MANIKTAISVQKPLFEAINEIAREMNISRSRFFVIAAEEYIQRLNNIKLLDALNEAYKDSPDQTEKEVLGGMKHLQQEISEGEW